MSRDLDLLDRFPDEIRQLRLGQCADFSGLGVAALEHDQGRDAANTKLLWNLGIGVHIDLAHLKFPAVVGGDLIEYRSDHLAGTAPFCPEIHQDRDGGFQYFCVKSRIADVYDLAAHVVLRFYAVSVTASF